MLRSLVGLGDVYKRQVLDGGGFSGCRVETWFVRSAEMVEIDLLGASPGRSLGVVACCVVGADDLPAVVSHAGDKNERGGADLSLIHI